MSNRRIEGQNRAIGQYAAAKAALDALPDLRQGVIYYATDEDTYYVFDGSVLVEFASGGGTTPPPTGDPQFPVDEFNWEGETSLIQVGVPDGDSITGPPQVTNQFRNAWTTDSLIGEFSIKWTLDVLNTGGIGILPNDNVPNLTSNEVLPLFNNSPDANEGYCLFESAGNLRVYDRGVSQTPFAYTLDTADVFEWRRGTDNIVRFLINDVEQYASPTADDRDMSMIFQVDDTGQDICRNIDITADQKNYIVNPTFSTGIGGYFGGVYDSGNQRLIIQDSGNDGLAQQIISGLTPGTEYTVTWDSTNNAVDTSGARVFDGPGFSGSGFSVLYVDFSQIPINTNPAQEFTFTFTPTGTQVGFEWRRQNSGVTTSFDNIRVTADVGGGGTPTLNGGVESTNFVGSGAAGNKITTGQDLAGNGGMAIFLNRSSSQNIWLYDTARNSGTAALLTSLNFGNTGNDAIQFDSDGITVGVSTNSGSWNSTGDNMNVVTFEEGAGYHEKVIYTGSGSPQAIAHTLGVKPKMIWVKRIDAAGDSWSVYVDTAAAGATVSYAMDNNGSKTTNIGYWNNVEPTTTDFTVGTFGPVNQNAATYIAYLWGGDRVQVTQGVGNTAVTPKPGSNIKFLLNFDEAGSNFILNTDTLSSIDANGRYFDLSFATGENVFGTPAISGDTFNLGNIGFSAVAKIAVSITED